MVGRDNAHIPKESWPVFTWFMIEFAIVFAVANLIAFQLMPTIREMFTEQSLLLCEQVSHQIKGEHVKQIRSVSQSQPERYLTARIQVLSLIHI